MVDDAHQQRAVGPPDPLGLPPRVDVAPNLNPAIGSVGPNTPTAGDPSAQQGSSGGYGASHVIYPADAPPITPMPWAGWPSQWAMPAWNTPLSLVGMLDVVFAAVDRNASAFASMPPSAVKGLNLAPNQPTWLRNPQPELYASWHEFAARVWWGFQVAGEVIIVCTSRYTDTGYPRTFFAVNPWLVQIDYTDGIRRYTVNGEDITDDVLHIRYLTVDDDPRGHGPLEAAGERSVAVRALLRYGADLALGGGVPWGVLKSKYRLSKEQAADLQNQWVTAARSRMGAPAVLDLETDLQVTQIQPKDMQLAELQQAAEARIAVLLGVPPYMLALPTHSGSLTYTNATLIYVEHYGFLRTKIAQIAGAISGWALPWGTEVEFDAERYIQPPASERADTYNVLFNIFDPQTGQRAMTIDEIRRAERIALQEAPS